jgi:di/tricarboxylate transporter
MIRSVFIFLYSVTFLVLGEIFKKLCQLFYLFSTVEKKLPWGVIILLGGGFALSDATEQ